MPFVWVFHGDGGRYPSGVFSARETAEAWIASHALSGLLTRYTLDVGGYEAATDRGNFVPKREDQTTSAFIQRFTDSFCHYHYEDGVCVA